jgi:hypothetical protein
MNNVRHHGRRGLTYLDLLVSLCLLLLIGAAAVPFVAAAREIDFRVGCASHLRMIGMAMMLYANDNKGAYPRVRYDLKDGAPLTIFTGFDSDDPFAREGAPEANDVTAAMYLLIRNADLYPSAFLCPRVVYEGLDDRERRRVDVKLDAPRPAPPRGRNWTTPPRWVSEPKWEERHMTMSNFPDPDDLHFSMANMYPPASAVQKGYKFHSGVVADLVIAADANPGNGALLKIPQRWQANSKLMSQVNSRNHAGEGQNVLFNDGRVQWYTHPFVGAERDHIYTYGKTDAERAGDGIVGAPGWKLDSILLPTADQKAALRKDAEK